VALIISGRTRSIPRGSSVRRRVAGDNEFAGFSGKRVPIIGTIEDGDDVSGRVQCRKYIK
jgi:hypothetical protein